MWAMYIAIWRVSGPRQILLILLAIAIAALAAVPLNFQKDIINELTEEVLDGADLVALCSGMMGVIVLSLGLKWVLGYSSGKLGEDVIRLIRNRIYSIANGDTVNKPVNVASGTLTTMISAEAEELGKFTGGAFSEPVVQIGTLISVVGFIASTQPRLGLIALMIIFPQIVIVLLTQLQVNRLVAQRVQVLRGATDKIVHQDVVEVQQAVLDDFDQIYETRRVMFVWKLSTKFVLSTINGMGTVAVLLLGGWLVIEGRTDVGTVVAATIGLGRLTAPTAFLIAFYRQVSATRVKYELLRDAGVLQPRSEAATAA